MTKPQLYMGRKTLMRFPQAAFGLYPREPAVTEFAGI